MTCPSSSERSQRQLRVGEQIRHVLIETMQHGLFLKDSEDNSIDTVSITITEVRISPDLKNATAYTNSLMGHSIESILPALNNAAALFQKELGKKLSLKFTPKIRFITDKSYGEADKIESLLRKIKDEES